MNFQTKTLETTPQTQINTENLTIYHIFWRRYFAAMLDGYAFFPFFLLTQHFFCTSVGDSIIAMFVALSYNIFCVAKYGQTFGKIALGIVILNKNGQKATIKQAFMREILVIIFVVQFFIIFLATENMFAIDQNKALKAYVMFCTFAMLIFGVLEFVTMLFNKKRRSLHDFIAHTIVVKQPPATLMQGKDWVLVVLIGFAVLNFVAALLPLFN